MDSFNSESQKHAQHVSSQSQPRPVLGRVGQNNPNVTPSAPQFSQLRRPNMDGAGRAPESAATTSNASNSALRRPNMSAGDELSAQTQQLTLNSQHSSDNANLNGVNYNQAGGDVAAPQSNTPTSWSAAVSRDLTPNTSKPASQIINSTLSSLSLNPLAPEFVPSRPAPVMVQDMTYANNGYNSAQGHDYNNYSSEWNTYGGDIAVSDTPASQEFDCDEFMALRFLREFIDQISVKPNKYESNISYLTDVMNNWIEEDQTVMSSAVNIIVDQAILETQFRYNGVRLCIHLMNSLRAISPEDSFTNLLFKRCQREVLRRAALINSKNGESYLGGLTLFIGDLYSRCCAPELAPCLPPLLETLISKPKSENLKCVCQVLKLCGSSLEDFYRGKDSDANELAKLMEKLSSFSDSQEVSPYTRELIQIVVEMQKRGWTALAPKPVVKQVNPYLNNSYPQEYLPGPSSNEFEEFISDEEGEVQTSYDFGACGDEDDTDVCAAFEEFLKNSGQTF